MNFQEKQHSLSCDYPEGCSCGASEWNRLVRSWEFHRSRTKLLQSVQHRMRDPERTMVCDILANGQLLEPEGSRYNVK